jgi:hypothetical protein
MRLATDEFSGFVTEEFRGATAEATEEETDLVFFEVEVLFDWESFLAVVVDLDLGLEVGLGLAVELDIAEEEEEGGGILVFF